MRLSAALLLFLQVLLFLSSVVAQEDFEPYNYGFDVTHVLRRQTAQRIVVSRLPSVNGTVPVRPEIRQMKRNARKWNLYILALSMMQNTGQDQELSWYQITGECPPGSSLRPPLPGSDTLQESTAFLL